MIFPAVGLGILPFQIALFNEAVDLIGGIGLGNVEKLRKLAHRGLTQYFDYLK